MGHGEYVCCHSKRRTHPHSRTSRQKAKFLYMMLDSSKIGKIKPYTFARAEDINVLITDDEFPDALKNQFKNMDIVVI